MTEEFQAVARSDHDAAECHEERITRQAPDDARAARAAARQLDFPGTIVSLDAPKPSLHQPSFTQQRLAHMAELCRRLWLASGQPIPTYSRAEMPGEVFEIEDDRTAAHG